MSIVTNIQIIGQDVWTAPDGNYGSFTLVTNFQLFILSGTCRMDLIVGDGATVNYTLVDSTGTDRAQGSVRIDASVPNTRATLPVCFLPSSVPPGIYTMRVDAGPNTILDAGDDWFSMIVIELDAGVGGMQVAASLGAASKKQKKTLKARPAARPAIGGRGARAKRRR